MSRMLLLQDLVATITERSYSLLYPGEKLSEDPSAILVICDSLLSNRGEASGVVMARRVLRVVAEFSDENAYAFFSALVEKYHPDGDAIASASRKYLEDQSDENLMCLMAASEPPRQELLRRLNLAPGGTAALVAMRKRLLTMMGEHPELKPLDRDLQHLFSSWFNRGFLVMRRIDWNTPANILAKIIEYEAVHEIADWEDLRRRIEPEDRHCYAFFHPALGDEPLIFVEVALSDQVPNGIADVLSEERLVFEADKSTVAVFYSISNCQEGLRNISFGHFLIKQVVEDLKDSLPNLKTFVTLSPVPGFTKWLEFEAKHGDEEAVLLREQLKIAGWYKNPELLGAMESRTKALAARYYLAAKRADGTPPDMVARFHLGNGASLDRINWLGDLSPKSVQQGAGLMVNYLYDLPRIEDNHEAYSDTRTIAASRSVRGLLPVMKLKKTAR